MTEHLNRNSRPGKWFGPEIDLLKAFDDFTGDEAWALIEIYNGLRKRLSRKQRKSLDCTGDDVAIFLRRDDRQSNVDGFISYCLEADGIQATRLERTAIHFVNCPLPIRSFVRQVPA